MVVIQIENRSNYTFIHHHLCNGQHLHHPSQKAYPAMHYYYDYEKFVRFIWLFILQTMLLFTENWINHIKGKLVKFPKPYNGTVKNDSERAEVETLQTDDIDTTAHINMECDVIPTSPQEVDPLGNVENCNGLDDDDNGALYSQTLNATLISSADHDVDVVDSIPKNRKILDMIPPKTRKMLTIRRASLPAIRTTSATESSLSHGIVSENCAALCAVWNVFVSVQNVVRGVWFFPFRSFPPRNHRSYRNWKKAAVTNTTHRRCVKC